MKTPIIFDCDPGHDDAIALIIALAHRDIIDLKAVTTSAGNQTIKKTTYNALRILTLCGAKIPVAPGAEKPIARDLEIAPSVHGESGLDGPVLPEPAYNCEECSALELLVKTLSESEEKVTIVATGPLTNIGILLTAYPKLKDKIAHFYIMGGGIDHGNWSVAAEFNILVDPEAAHIVFTSGIPITLAPLDVTEKALLLKEDIEDIRKIDTRVARLTAELADFFMIFHKEMGFKGAPLHDPCAVISLLYPEIFKSEDLHVKVITQPGDTLGMTLADRRVNPNKEKPNVKVLLDVDREKLVSVVKRAIATYK